MKTLERFCSFELAKLLKEKGFDAPCRFCTSASNDLGQLAFCSNPRNFNAHERFISRPTHQMVLDWLQKEKNILIDIHLDVEGEESTSWVFSVYEVIHPYGREAYARLYFEDDEPYELDQKDYITETAIEYVLTKMI